MDAASVTSHDDWEFWPLYMLRGVEETALNRSGFGGGSQL